MLYDAVVLPDGADAVRQLRADGRTLEFIKDQYRHCKPMLAFGDGAQLLDACGIADRASPIPASSSRRPMSTDAADRSSRRSPNIATSFARPIHRACDRTRISIHHDTTRRFDHG